MDAYPIVLRIVHIVSAVLWVGGVALYVLFVQPTAEKLGPRATSFMIQLDERKRLSTFLVIVAGLTILAGSLLYWRDSAGLDPDWITSSVGLGFTTGAVLAITAFLVGAFYLRPKVERMSAIGSELGTSGDEPSKAQMEEVQVLQVPDIRARGSRAAPAGRRCDGDRPVLVTEVRRERRQRRRAPPSPRPRTGS